MNLFLNLLVRNVIEREIEGEKVQMKPPAVCSAQLVQKFETEGPQIHCRLHATLTLTQTLNFQ